MRPSIPYRALCNAAGRVLLLALAASPLLTSTAKGAEPLRNTIDRLVAEKWKQKNLQPAKTSSDSEFLRRIYLDLTGVIPSYDEAVAFLDDTATDKRSKLIDKLIASPQFAAHQADIWDMLLFGRNPPGYGTDKREGFQNWLRQQFAGNTPYNKWAGDILRAEGNSVDQGAPMFLVQYKRQPEDATEAITQKFLGVQLQCARCHDHPFESWSQKDFFGMAAFLARLEVVDTGKSGKLTKFAIGEKNQGDVLFTGPAAEQTPGKKGEPIKPRFLHGEPLAEPELPKDIKDPRNFPSGKMPPAPVFSRKDQLASWITNPQNPYFPRAIANRIWGQFMGRGIVHPVDNMSESNEPTHPQLLDKLAAEMIAHKFDLQWYIREICNSETYQLSSLQPAVADTSAADGASRADGASTEAKPRYFVQARVRPLSAEELAASWRTATGYTSAKKNDRFAPFSSGYMLRFFGRPSNGEGDFQGGLSEHLYMNNGGLSKVLTTADDSLFKHISDNTQPMNKRVERLFISTLSRRPTADEQNKLVEYLAAEPGSRSRIQEAIWALLSCSEFRFNH